MRKFPMRKFIAIGLAGALALAGLGLTASPSNAGNKRHYSHHHQHHNYNRYYGGYNRYPGGGGLALGFAFGRLFNGFGPYYQPYNRPFYQPNYGYYPRYGYGQAYVGGGHVQRCLARYRTYNPATDMYYRRPGVLARCRL
jgi:hypothetical protein